MASVAMIVLFIGHVTAEVVHAEGNPHTHGATAPACCPVQSLDPATLYSGALLLSRQADTFDRVRTRKHLGTPIHIFSFRQPRRLSHAALPFDLVLVDDDSVDRTGTVELPADPASAADSWFVDYAWSAFVVCTAGGGTPIHLGWRYTRKSDATGPGPASFIALIVRVDRDGQQEAAILSEGKAVAAAVAIEVDGAMDEVDAGQLFASSHHGAVPLAVGVEAPSWMATMVVALSSARRAS